jgi:hypothetical protein
MRRKIEKLNEDEIIRLVLATVFFFLGFVVTFGGAINDRPTLILTIFALLAWMASSMNFGSQEPKKGEEKKGGYSTFIKAFIVFGPMIAGIVVGSLVLSGVAALSQPPLPLAASESIEEIDAQDQLTIESHFYEIKKTYLDLEGASAWVYPLSEEAILSVTSDLKVFQLAVQDPQSISLGTVLLDSVDLDRQLNGDEPKSLEHKILDIYVHSDKSEPDSATLFLSYATVDKRTECRTLNVEQIRIENTKVNNDVGFLAGTPFFRSECFPMDNEVLYQSGGRLAAVPAELRADPREHQFYLTIGEFQGLAQKSGELSENMNLQIGAVLEITKNTWKSISTGHRNPQGLLFAELGDRENVTLTSEHGPRGGDEINLIKEGRDYGWPSHSYGTAYKPGEPAHVIDNEGQSGASELPLYAWVPSIAPSQMIQVEGQEFGDWWRVQSASGAYGDILVSSLAGQSIFRMRIEDGSVRYVEPIEIGQRIRSFSQFPSGKLLIGTDSGQVLILSQTKVWSSAASDLISAR